MNTYQSLKVGILQSRISASARRYSSAGLTRYTGGKDMPEKTLMDTLGVSQEVTAKGQGGRWRGKRFDQQSDVGKKDWDEIMSALGIPRNKGYQYENKKFGEVVVNLAKALNAGEVKIQKK